MKCVRRLFNHDHPRWQHPHALLGQGLRQRLDEVRGVAAEPCGVRAAAGVCQGGGCSSRAVPDMNAARAVPKLLIASGGYCARRDSKRLTRFCGVTRMTPPRGLSMSAISRKEIDTTSGTTSDRMPSSLGLRVPVTKQQITAEGNCRHQTPSAIGIRFHQAACVYPSEFDTSFMPVTTRVTIGVGCADAGA
jgi:hypothetical protein